MEEDIFKCNFVTCLLTVVVWPSVDGNVETGSVSGAFVSTVVAAGTSPVKIWPRVTGFSVVSSTSFSTLDQLL
jgi:hypothetical protein